MDYLEVLQKQIGGKIKNQQYYSGRIPEGISYRRLDVNNRRGFKVQINDFGNLSDLIIKVHTGLGFSINQPDVISVFYQETSYEKIQYKIYLRELDKDLLLNDIGPFLRVTSELFNEFSLSSEEGVFIKYGDIHFTLHSDRDLLLIIDKVIDVILRHPEIFSIKQKMELSLALDNIPVNLRILFPLIKKWGVPDDSERSEMVKKMNAKQKAKLIEAVWPLMSDIDRYLDSLKDQPWPEEASLLGNLAELVAELRIE